MKTIGIVLGVAVSLALLVVLSEAILYGSGLLFQNFEVINGLNSETRALLIFGACLLLLCTFILTNAIRYGPRRNDKVVLPEKMMVYARLLELWGSSTDDYLLNEAALDQMRKPMALWAGDAVLKRFIKLCQQMEAKESPAVFNKSVEGLLQDIRKDIGHSNQGLVFTEWQKLLNMNDPQREAAVRDSMAAMHARQEQQP